MTGKSLVSMAPGFPARERRSIRYALACLVPLALLRAAPALAQDANLPPAATVAPTGQAPDTLSGQVGQRQAPAQLKTIKPTARISSRVQNRVNSRLHTRIDRAGGGGLASTDAAFKAANEETQRAGQPDPR